ncbi:nitroreductase family protein [Lichenihabitans psoromatis]|uniref:nitroreductase family protein n=1 Tax=Lichenihabitans psoromatis TaxID=2528642 RepID=UPI0010355299|nr:nitroreductase family protein [Lichenihabitans psoromatis]
MTTANSRTADHPIDPSFLNRWSPRAFDGQPISEADVLTLFEAARWAPSSYNSQPWRFLYARRDTPQWTTFLDLLNPFNRSWAERASLLIVAVSNSLMLPPGKDKPVPSHSHSFDAGAAWASLALQASHMGLQAHAMVGFDLDAAFSTLNVPEGHRVEAAIAVGRPGDKSILPEAMQAREQPNGRNPVSAFAFEGGFPAK